MSSEHTAMSTFSLSWYSSSFALCKSETACLSDSGEPVSTRSSVFLFMEEKYECDVFFGTGIDTASEVSGTYELPFLSDGSSFGVLAHENNISSTTLNATILQVAYPFCISCYLRLNLLYFHHHHRHR